MDPDFMTPDLAKPEAKARDDLNHFFFGSYKRFSIRTAISGGSFAIEHAAISIACTLRRRILMYFIDALTM
jgi:hypothetical protein